MRASGALSRSRRRALVALGAAGCAVLGRKGVAQAQPSLEVIVHPGVPGSRLDESELAALFGGTRKTWKDGTPIKVFNLTLNSPPRIEFDRVVLKMTQEEVSRYWTERRIRGEGTPPRQMASAELAARLVAVMPGSASYVPEGKAGQGVKVVARIRGGKVVPP